MRERPVPIEPRIQIHESSGRRIAELSIHAGFLELMVQRIGLSQVLGVTELPNEVGGSYERTILLVLLIISFGGRNGKSRGFNSAGYSGRVKNFTCCQAVHHKHFGP